MINVEEFKQNKKDFDVKKMQSKISQYCKKADHDACCDCELYDLRTPNEHGTGCIYDSDIDNLKARCDRIDELEREHSVELTEEHEHSVELTESELISLLEFIELEFIDSIRDNEETDNMEYLCNMCRVYEKAKEALKID